MAPLRWLSSAWRNLFRKARQDEELDEELRSYVELLTEEKIGQGMEAEEARRAALVEVGGVEQVKERVRGVRAGAVMETFLRDIRYGARSLRKSPGFTAVAVLTLALGIGANTAIFSVVYAVLLKPPPLRDADRLVMVWVEQPKIGAVHDEVPPATYADWKAQNHSFDEMAALTFQSFNITGDGEPEKVTAYGVTANLFPVLGVEPALGRTFLADEDRPGGAKVVVLSYGLWQRRYGGDRSVVGREILLNGEKYAVVGVMPRAFQFLQSYVGLWVPAALSPELLSRRNENSLTVLARLRPGVTAEQARADIGAISARIAHDYPDDAEGQESSVIPLREQLSGGSRGQLLLLLAAVGFVLLIACANIANLLLARAARRRKEIAVRTALGASRLRLARQLLTESVLLSLTGGAFGLLLAAWGFEFLKRLIPDALSLSTELKLSLPVLASATAISFATGILFGLAPALCASKADVADALKQGGGRTGLGTSGRLRGALVVTEVALSLVLLVGAGLLIQTIFSLRAQYAELHPSQLLTVRTVLPQNKYAASAKRAQFYDEVLSRVERLPGVVSAGYTTSVPLQWKGGANGFRIEGVEPPPGVITNAIHRQVSAHYLETVGLRLRDGRYFDEHDDARSQPVVIINETMARQFWSGESPLGKRISFGEGDDAEPWRTVVGVVADVRQMGMDEPVKAEMYIPYRQITTFPFYKPRDLVIRTAGGDPMSLVPALRSEIHAVDPDQPLSNIATMEEQLGEETASRGLAMRLLSAFAALALLLAAVGIYGVLAYFVEQHVPEIGVRLALGAQPRYILALVLKKGMGLAIGGIVLGLAASLALTRLMSGLLYGVSAIDPLTFAVVSLLLTLVAFFACYVPARRATKVDPMVALRYE